MCALFVSGAVNTCGHFCAPYKFSFICCVLTGSVAQVCSSHLVRQCDGATIRVSRQT